MHERAPPVSLQRIIGNKTYFNYQLGSSWWLHFKTRDRFKIMKIFTDFLVRHFKVSLDRPSRNIFLFFLSIEENQIERKEMDSKISNNTMGNIDRPTSRVLAPPGGKS